MVANRQGSQISHRKQIEHWYEASLHITHAAYNVILIRRICDFASSAAELHWISWNFLFREHADDTCLLRIIFVYCCLRNIGRISKFHQKLLFHQCPYILLASTNALKIFPIDFYRCFTVLRRNCEMNDVRWMMDSRRWMVNRELSTVNTVDAKDLCSFFSESLSKSVKLQQDDPHCNRAEDCWLTPELTVHTHSRCHLPC
jgi:hypothetical protein